MTASISSSTAQPLAIVGLRVAKQEQQSLLNVVSSALDNAQQIQASSEPRGQTGAGVGKALDISA